jgi:hypothetical protein
VLVIQGLQIGSLGIPVSTAPPFHHRSTSLTKWLKRAARSFCVQLLGTSPSVLGVATSTTNQCLHRMTFASSIVNGGHSPCQEESPSQSFPMHLNLPCIHHKWPLFIASELIVTPEMYEKLGQQHFDFLAAFGYYI